MSKTLPKQSSKNLQSKNAKNQNMRLSLKFKINIIIITTIFVFGGLATIIVFRQTRDKLIKLQEDNLEINTVKQAQIVKQVFKNSQNLVSTIAIQSEIINFLENFEYDSKQASSSAAQKNLENIIGILNQYNLGNNYSSIYIIDQDGLTLASIDQSFIGKNYGFRDYFKKAKSEDFAMDIAVGVTSKKMGYYFAQAIRNQNNQTMGVVVAKLKPESINETLAKEETIPQAISTNIKYMLIDEYGVVIAAADENKIYKSLGKLSQEKQQILIDKKRFGNMEITPLSYDQIQQEIDNISTIQLFEIDDDFDSEKEALVVKKLTDYPLFIISEIDLDVINQEAFSIALTLSMFVLAAALSAFILIYILIGQILKPLKNLKETAEEISRGDYRESTTYKTGDELEDLSKIFNKMTRKLIEHKDDTERKIKERTQQLEKLNKFMVGRELKMIKLKKEIKENKKTK
jgi:C4-dicarboxylate-specific signal transduction histidine kinase